MHEIVALDKIPSKEMLESAFPVEFNQEDRTVLIDGEWVPYTALYKEFLDMQQLCKKSDGIGLSAAQIGKPLPCFVASLDGTWRHFLNCKYRGMSFKKKSMEGCLSLPGRHFVLERYSKVKVWGHELVDDDGLKIVEVNKAFSRINSVIMQHEIDHHHGILISDIGKELELRR